MGVCLLIGISICIYMCVCVSMYIIIRIVAYEMIHPCMHQLRCFLAPTYVRLDIIYIDVDVDELPASPFVIWSRILLLAVFFFLSGLMSE